MATDDPILALEHQLVGAARRRAASPRRRIGGGVVAVAAAALVAVAVAAGTLVLLGGRSKPLTVPPATPTAHSQLVDMLGVLRNHHTKVDLATLPGTRPRKSHATVLVSSGRFARLAAVAPWGARIYFVPFYALGEDRLAILVRGATWRAANAAKIMRGRAVVYMRSVVHARSLRLIQVVPDGVARVSLLFAAGALIETVAVHGNVAAFQVSPDPAGRLALLWLDRGGRVLRRITLP